MQRLPDDECVALYQKGNKEAFVELVRRYQDRVYRYIARLIGSREEALELTQETLLKAFLGLSDWRANAPFRAWLFQIASNTAIDTLRRRRIVQYVPMDDEMDFEDHGTDPERNAHIAQRLRDLEALLARLAHEHREILLLREIEEMSYSEIGEILGLNEGTVKSRIARARAALLALCGTPLPAATPASTGKWNNQQ